MTAAPAIAGLSLADYSRDPQARGWGPPCTAPRLTVRLAEAAVTIDARAAELTGLIMLANEKQGYRYRKADTGAYNCRHIGNNPDLPMSNHAWALAVDANWLTNPMTRPLRTDRPRWELDRWNRFGFAWGGDYTGDTDPDTMHTEQMGTPDQVAQLTVIARRELQPIIDGTPAVTLPEEDDPDMYLLRNPKGTVVTIPYGEYVPGADSAAMQAKLGKPVTVSEDLFNRLVAAARK